MVFSTTPEREFCSYKTTVRDSFNEKSIGHYFKNRHKKLEHINDQYFKPIFGLTVNVF